MPRPRTAQYGQAHRAPVVRLGQESDSDTHAAPTAETHARADLAARRLETAIAQLPRALKEPLVLTTLEGLSHREAGAVLGINAKAVETRVYRAKRQLAVLLDPEDLADISAER